MLDTILVQSSLWCSVNYVNTLQIVKHMHFSLVSIVYVVKRSNNLAKC